MISDSFRDESQPQLNVNLIFCDQRQDSSLNSHMVERPWWVVMRKSSFNWLFLLENQGIATSPYQTSILNCKYQAGDSSAKECDSSSK
ncbi:MAG: hypothetical protein ACHQFX_16280 [Chitinophagales bacterium]